MTKCFLNSIWSHTPPYDLDVSVSDPTDNQPLLTDDMFIKNIDVPSDIGACMPRDNCFIPETQKYYVHGGNKIIVIDAITKLKEEEIVISNTSELFANELVYLCNEKRITYNSNTGSPYLYCVSLDGKFIIINYSTLEIIQEVDPYPLSNGDCKASIIYDNVNNVGFWFLSTSNGENRIGKFSNNHEIVSITTNYGINDITTRASTLKVYVSASGTDISRGLYEYDFNLENPFHITDEFDCGTLQIGNEKIYANNIENGVQQMFVYDFDTYSNEFDITYDYVFKTVYDDVSEMIFYTGWEKIQNNAIGLKVIRCDTDEELVNTFDVEYPIGLEINTVAGNTTIYCSGTSIMAINNLSVIYNQPLELSFSYDLTINNIQNNIVSLHPTSGNVNILNMNGILDTHINIGGVVMGGCVKEDDEGNYSCFAVSKNNFTSFLALVNNQTYLLESLIELPEEVNVLAIHCNQNNPYIYLAGEKANGEYALYEFNIETLAFDPLPVFATTRIIEMLFVAPNNKIYVGTIGPNIDTHGYIYIVEIENNYVFDEYDTEEGSFCYSDVKYFHNEILGEEKLFIVSICAQTVIAFKNDPDNSVDKEEITGGFSITYDHKNDIVYIGKNSGYINGYSWRLLDLGISHAYPTGTIFQLIYNSIMECFYGLTSEHLITQKLYDPYLSEIAEHESEVKIMDYNSINHKIYLYSLKNNEKESIIKVYDCHDNSFISDISLNNKYNVTIADYSNDYIYRQLLSHENKSNTYFTVNYSFSNISIVKASNDILPLRDGWNWKSFPRMERIDNDYTPTIPVLERVNYFPDLNMEIVAQNNDFLIYDDGEWDGDLNDLRSTKGYKLDLELNESMQPNIALHGTKLDPTTELTIYPSGENWVGYFVEEAQMPEDAIPAYVWDDLTAVKAQYWAMFKSTTEPYTWKIKGRVTPINYGDMIILESDAVVSFQWNQPQEAAEEMETTMTEYYSYEEQANYLPVFVETDSTSDIDEIAILANGEVVGASVRLPGDTLVEVNAYIEDVPFGTPLEFETWSDYKSAPVEKGSYSVKNPFNGAYEKRNIYKGERAKYHIASLKAGTVAKTPACISGATCSPNPFRSETLFTFRLNTTSPVSLRIYSQNGNLVCQLMNGTYPAGYYKTAWDGINSTGSRLDNGVYFYKLSSGDGEEISGKVVLIR